MCTPESSFSSDIPQTSDDNSSIFSGDEIDFTIVDENYSNQDSPSPNVISSISDDSSDNENVLNENVEYNFKDPKIVLSELKGKNTDKLIIAHININHLQNKFDPLVSIVHNKVDILVITETKIDDSYPTSQFLIEGYSTPLRLNRDRHGGGILIYVREDIPYKELKSEDITGGIECIFFEINLRKIKWILMAGYNPHKDIISNFLSNVSKKLDQYMKNYDNVILIGDFNSEMSENAMIEFCEMYDLQNLIKEPTCFKNVDNPSSIDVILTNRKENFQKSSAIEIGLSDHHKMVCTVLKSDFKKLDPISVKYRSYKYFEEHLFKNDLIKDLQDFNEELMNYDNFKTIFMTVLDRHAPMKTKMVRGNNAPFMNKTLSKAFMYRSKLKNTFNKKPTEENERLYKTQRNFCVNLLKKEKRNYYNNLDLKIFDDNKTFWKRIKPLFSNKHTGLQNNITIVEKDTVTSNKKEVAEKLNNFFIDAVENLDIDHFVTERNDNPSSGNIDEIIRNYETHPSILKIRENIKVTDKFAFNDTTPQYFKDEIRKLDPTKASIGNDIPAKMLVNSNDVVSDYLSDIYNNSKKDKKYPTSLKIADVVPIHKKDEKTSLKNYRPVSLIPIVSKLFERNMYDQIMAYIDKSLSPYLFGYRRGHSTEQCLTIMLEAWRKALDEKKCAGAVLTDLSKAFDCMSHDLLIAKLAAYGFDKSSLQFIYDYLKMRKQRTRINGEYSSWRSLKYGVPQGSILGPLLFIIFINDIFLFTKDAKIASYADDNTAYVIEDKTYNLLKTLETESSVILKWFRVNEMKSNDDKCHLIVANKNDVFITLGDEKITSTNSVELLGINIDNGLKFNEHILNILKKGNQKLHALARVSKYLTKDKLRIIMNTFIKSQFNYCPLIWMFHSRILNNKINKLHERALRIVYNEKNLTFEELLQKDNSITVHDRNLCKLAIEMYKAKHCLSPLPMQELFSTQANTHDLRNNRPWEMTRTRTVSHGIETIRYRGPKTWELLPPYIKESKSLPEFKSKIKTWKPIGCTCRLCKIYIANVGFIN